LEGRVLIKMKKQMKGIEEFGRGGVWRVHFSS
jgi:hypothetical protein